MGGRPARAVTGAFATPPEHLAFAQQPREPGRRTAIWDVTNDRGAWLGDVRWYPSWRRYTFNPAPRTVYDASCLTELAGFCTEQTAARKAARAAERAGGRG